MRIYFRHPNILVQCAYTFWLNALLVFSCAGSSISTLGQWVRLTNCHLRNLEEGAIQDHPTLPDHRNHPDQKESIKNCDVRAVLHSSNVFTTPLPQPNTSRRSRKYFIWNLTPKNFTSLETGFYRRISRWQGQKYFTRTFEHSKSKRIFSKISCSINCGIMMH